MDEPSAVAASPAPMAPLAERMRPSTLDDFVGQTHLVGPGKWLARAIDEGRVPSMIVWGPPGVGKTTLARLVAARARTAFIPFSAVLGNLSELRTIVASASARREIERRGTTVFVDEIHRFNKSQQDAFLPHVEAGTIALIGATTENPSFAVNAALLSRAKVVRLEPLSEADLARVVERAAARASASLGQGTAALLGRMARGDARRAIGALEAAIDHARSARPAEATVTRDDVVASAGEDALRYDRAGEEHYDVVSAFIKSMRGSDPDAALYWMTRMIDAGEDPLFVLRRMVIFASEDVGNADPRALLVANAADEAFRRLGMPEGMYPLAHAALYLASAPKSDGVKAAIGRARALVSEGGSLPVPYKLRNAVTALMKGDGYGEAYRDPHAEPGGFVPGETYLPEALVGRVVYEPVERGEEARIAARLAAIRKARG